MESFQVYDEKTFYAAFIKDLLKAKQEIVIESPFITIQRIIFFKPVLERIINKGVRVYVLTRPIEEQCDQMQYQAEKGIDILEEIGVIVITQKGYLHRKLAIIDKVVLYEGSLNILSQKNSKEIMLKTLNTGIINQITQMIT